MKRKKNDNSRILSMEGIHNGFDIKALNDGAEISAKFIDDGYGYHVEYNGLRFDLNQGHSIHHGGRGKDYHDDIIYIMYEPKDDTPIFVGWYCGAEWLERGWEEDYDFFYAVFWAIVEWVEENITDTKTVSENLWKNRDQKFGFEAKHDGNLVTITKGADLIELDSENLPMDEIFPYEPESYYLDINSISVYKVGSAEDIEKVLSGNGSEFFQFC